MEKSPPYLQASEQNRLDEIFNYFARTENKCLKFSEFVWFLLEKNIITNRHCFSEFKELFYKACAPDDMMSKQQFTYVITLLAQKLYQQEKTPIATMFSHILSEKNASTKDAVEPPKTPMFDEYNKRVTQEHCINVFCEYEKDLQRVYSLYISENISFGKLMLTWKEIAIQRKKMSSFCMVKFLKEADIVPNLISIEQFDDLMQRILPPLATKESAFYNSGAISRIEKEVQGDQELKLDGDPRFYLHEFQLAIGRIALESSKQADKKEDDSTIRKFLSKHLMLRSNEELTKKEPSTINRPFLRRLFASYQSEVRQKRTKQDQREDHQAELLAENQVEKLLQQPPVELNLKDLFTAFDAELPPFPPEINSERQNPPPYTFDKKVIGKPMPKPPPDKNAKKNQPKPPRKNKKDEDELPPPKWAGMPEPKPKTDFQHLSEYKNKREEEDELEELNSGVMSDIEVAPELIRENLYPVDLPEGIDTYIEAYLVSHNTANFPFALQNLEMAKLEWAKTLGVEDLPREYSLFFEFSTALVYESANRDDYALTHFINCKAIADKLPADSADRALPYCGIGTILYKTHDYKWALRCFLMARKIREEIVGSDTIDTATVYNNLGCCMYFLGRSHESMAYFQLAQAIMELELGPYHYRTATINRNISKCRKSEFNTKPEFKQLWQTFQIDRFPAKKKTSKKKKK